MPWDLFPGNRPNKPQSPNDVTSRPLPKSPVSSSLDNVVPQMIIRSPPARPGKFVFSDEKTFATQSEVKRTSQLRVPKSENDLTRTSDVKNTNGDTGASSFLVYNQAGQPVSCSLS